jgi:hypothetical protein
VYSLPRMITSEKGTGNCITSLFIGLCNAMLKNCHPNTYKLWGSWGDDVRQGVLTKPIHRKLGNIEQLHKKDYCPHGWNAVAWQPDTSNLCYPQDMKPASFFKLLYPLTCSLLASLTA